MAEGKNNTQAANKIGVHQEMESRWRDRWLESIPNLTSVEMNIKDDLELERLIIEL